MATAQKFTTALATLDADERRRLAEVLDSAGEAPDTLQFMRRAGVRLATSGKSVNAVELIAALTELSRAVPKSEKLTLGTAYDLSFALFGDYIDEHDMTASEFTDALVDGSIGHSDLMP